MTMNALGDKVVPIRAVIDSPLVEAESSAAKDCTAKQEAFALAWARTGSKVAAYRIAYNVRPNTLPNSMYANAIRVSELPQVHKRYKELSEQAALEAILSACELYKICADIATADPNEVVRLVHRCCRYCYGGPSYLYQWKDDAEYTQACVEALDKGLMPPLDDGGYGYNGSLEPEPLCPHCYGEGITQVLFTPSDKLTGKARRLYAGAKQDRFGCVEVKLHDQKGYAELAARILGIIKEAGYDTRSSTEKERANAELKVLPESITVENAAKAYLQLVS